ncbi:hypothetical protein LXA43DRAFT_1101796 [Ganoderma leucocontextum]|nr:hypothetical protein LXA43DRAFT_1101796 [Ganoderma leucocontextum]
MSCVVGLDISSAPSGGPPMTDSSTRHRATTTWSTPAPMYTVMPPFSLEPASLTTAITLDTVSRSQRTFVPERSTYICCLFFDTPLNQPLHQQQQWCRVQRKADVSFPRNTAHRDRGTGMSVLEPGQAPRLG